MTLFDITQENYDILLDIRYASTNNILNKPLYETPFCLLNEAARPALEKAILLAQEKGLRFKVFDAWRPFEVQEAFYAAAPDIFSDPQNGAAPHCRGIAIDLTLVDENGQELDMGTDFDDLTEKAYHDCPAVDEAAKKNRKTLLKIMLDAGWDWFDQEWWHYQLFNPRSYPVISS